MGRRANIFNKATLVSANIAEIIDKAVAFDAKMKGREVKTRDTLRADCLIKALVSISEASFNSKSSINNKLLDLLLSRDEQVTNKVADHLLYLGGYKYSDINNMIYYLAWYACSDEDPIYNTLDEFAESLAA